MEATGEQASAGIRTEVQISKPGDCPVAAASAEARSSITSVSRSIPSEGVVHEDFTISSDSEVGSLAATPIFDTGTTTTYRFERTRERPCACESVERFDFPIADVTARNGSLFLTFYAPDMGTVKEIVAVLREQYDDVSIHHLSRTGTADEQDLAFVDRSALTDRQLEVLETAHEMGYFHHPKGANAGEVAAALDIAPSTLSEHLAAAQSKVMDSILTGDVE